MIDTNIRAGMAALTSAVALTFGGAAFADPEAVFDHHLQAFVDRNMEQNLADYTDDSVVIIPNAIFRGLDEIEGFFGAIFQEFAQDGSSFELTEKRVEGNVVYISWRAETPDNSYVYATDTFVIENDKIVTQTIGLVVEPK
ncbi:nuclear transport factor 2 family protein [Cognatishimia sp. SS12]|uniref:nuclear transport factor 2 family protein n=1 Tax=Cognatishimia sp. SS12 TaxID=2979465 RepID=UPI0023314862|nr:nuclear transport factor 2 family protein [Cognatishimia sp. SS12]MDC0738324.1 nuclear transport factor 2 family protein [Cognatishimia sp. SS12]